MWAAELRPPSLHSMLVSWCILPKNISAVTSSLAGSLISFQLTPSHISGISLHFLTLSYGGGCFLGAFLIQLVYFFSGGKINTILFYSTCFLMKTTWWWGQSVMKSTMTHVIIMIWAQCHSVTGNFYPNTLHDGNLERFFFLLATLMAINTLVYWRVSYRYSFSSLDYKVE